jgi:hypothetical protein
MEKKQAALPMYLNVLVGVMGVATYFLLVQKGDICIKSLVFATAQTS